MAFIRAIFGNKYRKLPESQFGLYVESRLPMVVGIFFERGLDGLDGCETYLRFA